MSYYDFWNPHLISSQNDKIPMNQFVQFQTMIFEILTKFHHKMIKYKRNQFFKFQTMSLWNPY